MNLTTIRLDLRRLFREPAIPIFVIGMPALMFVIFGGIAEWSDLPVGESNASMVVMVNMALYGAVTAMVSISSTAATEKMQGWGRQLGLSGQSDVQYIFSKVLVGLIMAVFTIAVIFALGLGFGSKAPGTAWILSFFVILGTASIFALYGLSVGLFFRSDVAVTVSTGLLVVFGFLGNVFSPLGDGLYKVAQFTPLFGAGVLSRYPTAEGITFTTAGKLQLENLTIASINFAVWAVLFFVFALIAVRKSRQR